MHNCEPVVRNETTQMIYWLDAHLQTENGAAEILLPHVNFQQTWPLSALSSGQPLTLHLTPLEEGEDWESYLRALLINSARLKHTFFFFRNWQYQGGRGGGGGVCAQAFLSCQTTSAHNKKLYRPRRVWDVEHGEMYRGH